MVLTERFKTVAQPDITNATMQKWLARETCSEWSIDQVMRARNELQCPPARGGKRKGRGPHGAVVIRHGRAV